MHTTRLATLALGGLLGSLALSACDLDVPDLNDPGLDVLQNAPTAAAINAACTGLLIGNRRNMAAANGYVSQLGILGRESYNFDSADPRFVTELLAGTLNQGSVFGGNFWGGPYGNIRLANVILNALEKIPAGELSDSTKTAIRGFVNTIVALDLLEVIVTHDTNGAVIDTNRALTDPLGPIVDKPTTYAKIVELLEGAAADLATAAATEKTFPFLLSSGYKGFDTPATFRMFNRAIRARVAAHLKNYQDVLTALGESFLKDAGMVDLNVGVFHVYTTKPGDVTNRLIARSIFGHPSLETDAQKNGAAIDARFTRKITKTEKPGSVTGTPLTSSLQFGGLYKSPSSPVPLIRNEELILLKAEALYFTKMGDDDAAAIAELNLVRVQSGGLAPLVGPLSRTQFVDALLYERRYSLLFEGHRWIDVRRFNRMEDLPLDDPGYVRNVRYPIPLPECNARPGEPRCELGSL
jgi:hypothetical protein